MPHKSQIAYDKVTQIYSGPEEVTMNKATFKVTR